MQTQKTQTDSELKKVGNNQRSTACYGVAGPMKIMCLSLLGVGLVLPVKAVPTFTLAGGVVNPAPSLNSTALNPQQTAIADTVAVVPLANFSAILQSTLTQQGYSAANKWTLVNNAVTLNNNATFNLTTYNLFLNPGGNNQPGLPNGTAAGSAFGENINFTLNPNLAGPVVPAGSTATLHWLQLINEDTMLAGGTFGFAVAGQNGFWALDNGFVNGAAAAGAAVATAANAPYYDSNSGPNIVPPAFSDSPKFFAGAGKYLHFTAIPTWDIFTPAAAGNPATENIDVADYGVTWGFSVVVPEPSAITLLLFGAGSICLARRKRKS